MSAPAPPAPPPGQDVYDVLGALRMAMAQLKLYRRESPQVAKVAGGVHQVLTVYLDANDGLSLASTPEGVLANGKRLTGTDAVQVSLEASLQATLKEVGIRSLRFLRGIAPEELIVFLYALGHRFWDLKEGTAVNARLLEEGVRNAKVDEVEYVAVGKSDVVLKDAADALEAAKMSPKEFLDALEGRVEAAALEGNGTATRADLMLRMLRQDPSVLTALMGQDSPTGLVGDALASMKFPETVRIIGLLLNAAGTMPEAVDALRPATDALLEPFKVHTLLRPSMKAALAAVAPSLVPLWMQEDLPPGQEPGVVRRIRDILALTPAVRAEAIGREGKALLQEALSIGRADLAEQVLTLLTGLLSDGSAGQRRMAADALASLQEVLGTDAAKAPRELLEEKVKEVLEKERDARAYSSMTNLAGALVDTRLKKGEVNDALRMIDILKKHSTIKDAVFPERLRLVMPALEKVTSGQGYKLIASTMKTVDPTAERLQRAVDQAAVRFLVSELKSIENLQERLRVAETIARLGQDGIQALRDEAQSTKVPSEALRLVEVIPAAVAQDDAEEILRGLVNDHAVMAVRRRAAVLLAQKGYARAGDILHFAFETQKDPATRAMLIEAIGHLKDGSAEKTLLAAAEARGEMEEVRATACLTLGRAGIEAAIPLLVELSSRGPRGLTRLIRTVPLTVRLAAIRGLGGFLTHAEAEQALKTALEDTDPTVRIAATNALRPPTRPFAAPPPPAAATAPAAAAAAPGALTGLLSEMPLDTLFQSLATGVRTGTLRIMAAEGVAVAHFLKGAVVAIDCGERKDVDALRGLLTLRSGAFSFRNGEIPADRRISLTVQALLLEAMRPPPEVSTTFELPA